MTNSESLQTFATKFIIPAARDRFLHEALRKPVKLHERICHSISELLEITYAGKELKFNPEQQCLMLAGGKGFTLTTWKVAEKSMGSGAGLLVISVDGVSFYAETESINGMPSITYSGC